MAENINETSYPPMEMPDEEILNDQFDEVIEETIAEVKGNTTCFIFMLGIYLYNIVETMCKHKIHAFFL